MSIQVSENQMFAIYRVYTRLDFLVLPINIFVVCSITKLMLISNRDFIEQIIVFRSNCRASAHLDFHQPIIFCRVGYNSMYQIFWYTASRVAICTRNSCTRDAVYQKFLGTWPGVPICTRNRSTKILF